MNELCGQPTSTGKPCSMPKGHSAKFHRYRDYRAPLQWVIKNQGTKKILEEGTGRKELGYAMTYWLKKGFNLTMEVSHKSPAKST